MLAVGDGTVWRKMVDAALIARWDMPESLGHEAPPPGGSDEEGDVPIQPDVPLVADDASWIQVRAAGAPCGTGADSMPPPKH